MLMATYRERLGWKAISLLLLILAFRQWLLVYAPMYKRDHDLTVSHLYVQPSFLCTSHGWRYHCRNGASHMYVNHRTSRLSSCKCLGNNCFINVICSFSFVFTSHSGSSYHWSYTFSLNTLLSFSDSLFIVPWKIKSVSFALSPNAYSDHLLCG